MIALLQRQIVSLEGVINTLRRVLAKSRGEPAPARIGAATAAQAAPMPTAAKRKATSTTPATAANGKAPAAMSKAATAFQLAGPSHRRRLKGAQAPQWGSPPPPPPHPRSPCVWTGTGSGYRSLEHRDRCLCRSAPACSPLRLPQPYSAQEDIRTARSNIALWGIGGVAEGSAPPPPPRKPALVARTTPRHRSCSAGFPAGRGAGGGGCRPHHWALAPVQPTAAALWALLPSTTAMQPLRLYQDESRDTIREWAMANLAGSTPGRVETSLPRGGSTMCGIRGLHGPQGPPRGCGRSHGPWQRPAGNSPGARLGCQQGRPQGGGPAADPPPVEG